MLGYGILQFILLARMLPWITRRFVPSIWSFSFGITALATATETLTLRGDKGAIAMLSMPAFLIANVLVGVFAVGTLMLLAQRRLLPAPTSLEPLLNASPGIQIHAAFAVLALVLGAIQLIRVTKGDWLHKLLGRTWVVLMAVVAGASFFIW